ncbi:NAD(P)-dependent oxidoreductase [Alkaliphilus crotonatoxidans]
MSNTVIEEARRCLNCKIPQCRKKCPISTDIPGFIQLLLQGEIQQAGENIFKNNPLSVICSIVCPHEAQCESGCILGRKGNPVKIGTIENYISDYYLNFTSRAPALRVSGRIAIIGSGPSGLAAAFILAQKGYNITLFEAQDRIGGFLRYGIPEFRLPNKIIDTLEQRLKELGVKIRPNTLIGPVITIDTLFNDGYDAIFIATGVWEPNTLGIKGESLGHVHYAVSYLKNPDVYDLGERLVVVGGGNTAMDAARTAIRKGTRNVVIAYRRELQQMPANQLEIEMAQMDGVKFEFLTSPLEIVDDGMKCIRNQVVDGRLIPVEGSEFLMEADSIIIAVSQGPRTNIVKNTNGIETDERGLVMVDERGMTSREGVFASGDVVTGAKTVVLAVQKSKIACESIEAFIREKQN